MNKAKHCDTCQHKTVEEAILTGGQWKTCVLTCAIGHKPRFFKPRYIHDYEWGWKRKCEDYKNADQRETCALGKAAAQTDAVRT